MEALLSMISLRVSSADNGDYGVVVVQLLTFCNPMNFSRPSFLVIHYLLEFAQTQSIELVIPFNHLIICHPFLNLSQHQGLFQSKCGLLEKGMPNHICILASRIQ